MGTPRPTVVLRGGLLRRFVVVAGLAGFVLATYVLLVLGGGLVVGRTASPSVGLSVLATAVVALSFAPVQSALEGLADRLGHPAAATPYDVLSRFPGAVTGGDAAAELPMRMATMLTQGTGAQWAEVWLHVSGRLTLAATWPPHPGGPPPPRSGDGADPPDGLRSLPVRDDGEVLGVLRLQERPGSALTAVEERLFTGLAAQAGRMLRLVALRADLEERRAELAARAEELKASRGRLIAAQDAERRRLERDIHDGAQQHLVALMVNLRLAETIAARSPARAALVLAEQADAARAAIETLSALSRGIYPRTLADDGLLPALRTEAVTSAIPVAIDGTIGRLPAAVEAALYFCCMEAVQNAAKHSGAGGVSVRVDELPRGWRLSIADDGVGFDRADAGRSGTGAGLVNMRDRIDAVGGTLTVTSAPGAGTTVTAEVPRAQLDEPGTPRTAVGQAA